MSSAMELQQKDETNVQMPKFTNYDLSSCPESTEWYQEKKNLRIAAGIVLVLFIVLFVGGYYAGVGKSGKVPVTNGGGVTDKIHRSSTTETVVTTPTPKPELKWDGFCPQKKEECPNSFKEKQPLLLLTYDGFRPDYLYRNLTPTFRNLSLCGASAPHIFPAFPSKTIGNHFTMATGLHPSSHGILDGQMFDSVLNESFHVRRPGYLDQKWWHAEPLWITAQKQNKSTACFSYPGSEVEYDGMLPTYMKEYGPDTTMEERVASIFEWLDLPVEKRPDFVAVYTSMPDKAAHHYGTAARQVNDALVDVDEMMYMLFVGLQERGILNCVNVIIVADHGMSDIGCERLIKLVDHMDLSDAMIIGETFGRLYPYDNSTEGIQKMVESLQCKDKHMRAYHKSQLPIRFHFSNNPRIEPIFLELDIGWIISSEEGPIFRCRRGAHGFDNFHDQMKALFMVHGPVFKFNYTVDPFVNLELYELMAELLNVTSNPNNGTKGSLHHILKNPNPLPEQEEPEPPETGNVPNEEEAYKFNVYAANCSCKQTIIQEDRNDTAILKAKHLPFGVPYSPEDMPTLRLLHNNDYIAAYDIKYRLPMWSSFTLKRKPKDSIAKVCWKGDARISYENTSKCSDYNEPMVEKQGIIQSPLFPIGYASENYTEEAEYVTNAVPKHEKYINYIEVRFHQIIEALLRMKNSLNVINGPAFNLDANEVRPHISTIMMEHAKYGPLVVPTHYFFIITWCKTQDVSIEKCEASQIGVVSFLLPNIPMENNCESPDARVREHIARVGDVETLTGISFFTGLPIYEAIRLRIAIPELDV